MAISLESLMPLLPTMVRMLPDIINAAFLMFYLVLIFFFGRIAAKGYVKKLPGLLRWLLVIGSGYLCLAGGFAFSTMFPWIESSLNLPFGFALASSIGGIIFSVLVGICLFVFSMRVPSGISANDLSKELGKIKDLLIEKKILKSITPDDAKKIAEDHIGDQPYSPDKPMLSGGNWVVPMKSGDRELSVIIDSFDGTVMKVKRFQNKYVDFLMDPYKILAIAALCIIIVFAFFNFRGLPNPVDDMLGQWFEGSELENVKSILGNNENSECASFLSVFGSIPTSNGLPDITLLEDVENNEAKSLLESQSGDMVVLLKKVIHDKEEYILGVTDNSKVCIAKGEIFCQCIDANV